MKVFERNCTDFDYPNDMAVIMDHLTQNGRVNVSAKTIETLYRRYSDECWCGGWMDVDTTGVLNGFTSWLEEIDIEDVDSRCRSKL